MTAPAPRPRVSNAPPTRVHRLLRAWHRAESAIGVAAIATMAIVLIVDVLGRELLGPLLVLFGYPAGPTGVHGAPKLAIYALAIATYAGVGVATARGTHLVPKIAFRAVPRAWGPAVDRLGDLFSGLCLLAVAAYGLRLAASSLQLGVRVPMLDWPLWSVQIALPAGFASASGRYLCYAAWPALRPDRADAER